MLGNDLEERKAGDVGERDGAMVGLMSLSR